MSETVSVDRVSEYLLTLQDNICDELESLDGQAFKEDRWEHAHGGGGRTRVLTEGGIFEQAGVNYSRVRGTQLPKAATAARPELANSEFEATGVSMVLHPKSPMVPTMHANVRFFKATTQEGKELWWFGGGFDLTPYYGFTEDCIHWHQVAKKACDPFGEELYPMYKKWADDYFFLKHRNEARGIGGLFFDDMNGLGFEKSFEFLQSVGNAIMPAYRPIVERRKATPFTEAQKDYQRYRRGRYVEFNLLYDRGTLFGLQSNGRTESILMSLPPSVRWEYNFVPEKGSEEAKLLDYYLKSKEWIEETV